MRFKINESVDAVHKVRNGGELADNQCDQKTP